MEQLQCTEKQHCPLIIPKFTETGLSLLGIVFVVSWLFWIFIAVLELSLSTIMFRILAPLFVIGTVLLLIGLCFNL